MSFRDLLIALPGLINPVTPVRAAEAELATSQFGLMTTQADVDPFGLNAPTTGSGTLRDFYRANDISIEKPVLVAMSPVEAETPAETPGTDEGASGSDDPVDDTPVDSGPIDNAPIDNAPVDNGAGAADGDEVSAPDFASLPVGTGPVSVEAGRVAIIAPVNDAPIADVKILSQASHGHVSVNPDKTLALVLSEDPDDVAPLSFAYQVTYQNGTTKEITANVEVTPGAQEAGWGQGDFYMLETDRDGDLIVEHGENHRKIHVTMGEHGLTAAEIAKTEGLSANTITGKWLLDHPEYGSTPETALSEELGLDLWYTSTNAKYGPTSNWLLLERGYEYENAERLLSPGASGESELHPMLIGAYGEGSDPVIGGEIQIYQRDSDHVVIRDIDAPGMMVLQGNNILLDRMSFTDKMLNLQSVDGLTLRRSDIVDIVHDSPDSKVDYWHPSLNRTGGAYASGNTGLLLEGNFLDHNGWAEGYDYNLSADAPQPPSYFSHNFYVSHTNLDVTLRDNIIMRGASFGAQVRSGGVIEDNSFIDNNAAVSFLGGSYKDSGPVANYTLFLDNVITSAGHKRVAAKEGALSMGVDDGGQQSTLIGNIIAHLADPNNPAEIAEKTVTHDPLDLNETTFFDDSIVYNWESNPTSPNNPEANVEGLDRGVLDQTTIQNFTAQLLGRDSATIADLGDYLRSQAAGKLDHVVDADLINAYFREGFGLSTTLRAQETTLRFAPDERGDGMRWDNRLNWSTTDLPGTQDGDSVDLGGNRVLFGAQTVTIDDFIFGDYGELKATSGRLNIAGEVRVSDTGGLFEVDRAGQIWIDGYHDDDLLRIDAQGGRFANTGAFAGPVELTAGDNAQALLASAGASFDLRQGSSLTIEGANVRAGFDGASGDTALLRLHDGAQINIVADETGLGQIREFYSGAFGDSSAVTSGIRLDGRLSVDLSGWTAEKTAQEWRLIDADQIVGAFDDVQVTGLAANRDVLVRVNYISDDVTLLLSKAGAGSGMVRVTETGDADFINYTTDDALKSLWAGLHQPAPEMSDL